MHSEEEVNRYSFKLNNKQEALIFDELLDKYLRVSTEKHHISLGRIWDTLESNPKGGQLFTAFLDLRINLVLLEMDISTICGILNREPEGITLPDSLALSDVKLFFNSMELHRANNAFVLRCRAIWDKILGVIVLIVAPENYEKFQKGDSRQKMFQGIAKLTRKISLEFCEHILQVITDFDDQYRTPEAHGMGKIRKWTFAAVRGDDSPQVGIIDAWNELNHVVLCLPRLLVDPGLAMLPDLGLEQIK